MAKAARKKNPAVAMIEFSRTRDIPFNRIRLSDSNVRETDVEADERVLAAARARHGTPLRLTATEERLEDVLETEGASGAWDCNFNGGHQGHSLKSFEGSAVAVRLIPISA